MVEMDAARADRLADRIRGYVEEEGAEMANTIEIDGHGYVNDFMNGKYYRDGEEISRAEFSRAIGSDAPAKKDRPARRRKPRDVAFECEVPGTGTVRLTAKQRAFLDAAMGAAPGYEWATSLVVEASGMPQVVAGAMISTLKEKGLAEVSVRGEGRNREKVMSLTVAGRAVAKAMSGSGE